MAAHTLYGWIALAIASIAAGLVNAIAGGGTLISFPTLLAMGVPAIDASVTNTVALSPGYLGGTLAQREDLVGQRPRLLRLVPSAMLGGIVGGLLLLLTSEAIFARIVPFLILLACASLASQDRIRAWIARRQQREGARSKARRKIPGVLAVFLASVYGGYFGAGLGILLLAVLGVVLDDTLVRLNALKQALSLTINMTAALFFLFSGRVAWPMAAVMALGSLLGGHLGGRIAKRLDPALLRRAVIALGLVIAGIHLAR